MSVDVNLTQGKMAAIDECDLDRVSRYKWTAIRGRKTWYAKTRISGMTVQLQRFIMGNPSGLWVDHVDGNGLNNTRENLRLASRIQNQRNRGKNKNNTSGYKGVSYYKARDKWCAYITVGKSHKCLGYFDSAFAAAGAYDKAAIELYGEFAKLNFPSDKG